MICSSAKDKIISYRNRYNQAIAALKNKTRTQNYIRDLAVGTADRQGYKDLNSTPHYSFYEIQIRPTAAHEKSPRIKSSRALRIPYLY
jgi:hypothetical protein